jgi:hypothetical protein
VAGADLHDRVGLKVRELTGAQAGAASSSTTSRSRASLLARAAAISLAASRSLRNFGSVRGCT